MHLFFAVLLGWICSLMGQLPLGALSITATQIAVQEGFAQAWKYSFGVALAEIIYLRVVLSGLNLVSQHGVVFLVTGWLTVIVFLVLGILCVLKAQKQLPDKKSPLLNNSIGRFWLGVSMSALNPAQVPFWFIWSTYFMEVKLLYPGFSSFNLFTVGAGLGTICGLAIYMYAGNWMIIKMKASNRTLNRITGIVFVIAALAQLYRLAAR